MTPDITLNDGTTIPQLGFGTLNVPPDRAASEENTAKTAEIVGQAIAVGYRHVDTAQMYGNEREVGDGLRASGVPREDVFITNVLRCRPPGNRDPHPVEIERCQDWLFRTIELVRPTVICTLGNFAT